MIGIVGKDGGHRALFQEELVDGGEEVDVVVGAEEVPVADELSRGGPEVLVEATARQPPAPELRVLGELVQGQALAPRLAHVALAPHDAALARHPRHDDPPTPTLALSSLFRLQLGRLCFFFFKKLQKTLPPSLSVSASSSLVANKI